MAFAMRQTRVNENGPVVRWLTTQQAVHASRRAGIAPCLWLVVLLIGMPPVTAAPVATARWTIGHAAVQADPGARGQLQVKLSLRNQGQADRSTVQLFGRWVPAAQASRRIAAQELSMFALLGRYEREVALKQTAVVTAPLAPLRPPPSSAHVLELAVLTGAAMTDQGRVAVHAP